MKRTSNRMWLCITLLILNLIFIWGNSALPGEVSGCLSEWVKGILGRILPFGQSESAEGSHLLRKLAHFIEFACLGACLCWLAGMLVKPAISVASLPLLGGFIAACVDETIQRFVEGRSSSLIDVWIDTAGVVIGILLLLTGYHVIGKIKHRRVRL